MRKGIPAALYTAPDQYQAEMAEVFARHWIPVGLSSSLAEHDSFLVTTIAGREVVVQNFQGELRAFLNVCPHRFNRLQTAPCGTRELVCGYHGWGFGSDGVPCRIPKRPKFDDIAPHEHALKRYDLDRCGKLVFVRLASGGPSLIEWLGPAYPRVKLMSMICGHATGAESTFDIKANWKVIVENTLEAYHVGHVHKTTFHRLGAGDGQFENLESPHTTWVADVSDKARKSLDAVLPAFEGRPYQTDQYVHQLVWPNCTLATLGGMTVAVQFVTPRSVGRSTFSTATYLTEWNADTPTADSALHAEQRAAFGRFAGDFNTTVFAEDAAVCESVQAGASNAGEDILGCLSDEEERVANFISATMLACDGRL